MGETINTIDTHIFFGGNQWKTIPVDMKKQWLWKQFMYWYWAYNAVWSLASIKVKQCYTKVNAKLVYDLNAEYTCLVDAQTNQSSLWSIVLAKNVQSKIWFG